ncbi:MAG TPA: isomerase [Cytophagales bacterium]|jgi:predicted PhzF superfamily epimerase YddE/YHI9|nr:isomerase [Cytophagales bacterium]
MSDLELPIYQVEAFTNHVFGGNPAAVIILEHPIREKQMQHIALENNLSETAFVWRDRHGEAWIRWFTPEKEVDLCGHATLASAHVFLNEINKNQNIIAFNYEGGRLLIKKHGESLKMTFPLWPVKSIQPNPKWQNLFSGNDVGWFSYRDMMVVLPNEKAVADFVPDLGQIANLPNEALVITAPGDDSDFVSRFFAPKMGISEDPVTGSAHCALAPYWAGILGKKKLHARQLSHRGGELKLEVQNDLVIIEGSCKTYLKGTIYPES